MAPLFKVEQQDFTRGRFIGQQARAAPSKAEPECRRTALLYQEQPLQMAGARRADPLNKTDAHRAGILQTPPKKKTTARR